MDEEILLGSHLATTNSPCGAVSVVLMSTFSSLWRVWIGIALVLFFGVPIFSVLLWISGGILGLVVLVAIAAFVLIYMLSNKPQ